MFDKEKTLTRSSVQIGAVFLGLAGAAFGMNEFLESRGDYDLGISEKALVKAVNSAQQYDSLDGQFFVRSRSSTEAVFGAFQERHPELDVTKAEEQVIGNVKGVAVSASRK